MKRLFFIAIALLLIFVMMGFMFTDDPNYQPLSFKYMLETLSDLDFSFAAFKQWWNNVSSFVQQLSIVQTDPLQLLNPFYWLSLIATVIMAPVNLLIVFAVELFNILNNFFIIFNRLIMVV